MENHQTFQADHTLIEQFQAGNTTSFNLITKRYQSSVYDAILKQMQDSDLAKDLTQDTFVRAFEYLRNPAKQYDATGSLHNWLKRIAYNICMDHFRKASRTPFMIPVENLITDDDIAMPHYQKSPEELQIDAEWQTIIHACIKELPDEQKEVLLMRMYSNLSFKEIALLSDVSINTALGRMRYALRRLAYHVKATDTGALRVAS